MKGDNQVRASLRRHKGRAGESANAYRQRELSRFRSRLRERRSVYLDINYWIDLRSAAGGAPRLPAFEELLALLRTRVEAGAIFCPVSGSVLMELGKQSDPASRSATARLMDELCAGAGVMSDDDLMAEEIENLLLTDFPRQRLSAPRHLVWMPVGCIAADPLPPPAPISVTRQQQQRLEKVYFDSLLTAKVADLAAMDFERHDVSTWANLARELNDGKVEHQNEFKTFDDLLLSELLGAADACQPMIAEAVERLRLELKLPPDTLVMGPKWRNLVGLALKRNQQARAAVPSLFVRAGLHALARWNRSQKFKPNDFFDFAHAAGALGYCDCFLTEGPLKDLLSRGPLRLSDASDCRVVANPAHAIATVAAL